MIRASTVAYEPESQGERAPPPSIPEVRAALDRFVVSPQMRCAPRLVGFLRYVVEATLAGQHCRIKSYTIAVEALGRDPSFDPQADPIVRVEAGRLRAALAHYYAGSGRDDPVVIELWRGSYVPVFRHAHASEVRSADGVTLHGLCGRLHDLHRQLKAITTEIESAQTLMERAAHAARRRQ
jgi:hypothetical protein